jgi:flagellar motor switch protein FliN/FliY
MAMRDVLQLASGSVVQLDKAAGSPVDLLVNGKRFARGEVVVVDDRFGIRITEIIASPS